MKITPIGTVGGEVTGSCYSVQAKRARILADCGLPMRPAMRGAEPAAARAKSKSPARCEAIEL